MTKYNYHDGGLQKAELTDNTLNLWVLPYSVFYLEATPVLLRFFLSNKSQKLQKWLGEVNDFLTEDGESDTFARIQSIDIKQNTDKFVCEIRCDYLTPLQFQCTHFEEINN